MPQRTDVLGAEDGRGPLFHRRYRTRIGEASLSAPSLMLELKRDVNRAAPTKFARFAKVLGDAGQIVGGHIPTNRARRSALPRSS